MRKTVLAATTALVVASGAMIGQATAADLDYMPAPAPAPPPFIQTWQGFYIGGHFGYGEADFDADMAGEWYDDGVFLGEETYGVGLGLDGLIGGVQGGYNWQVGSMVFGIEGDVSFTNWDQGSTFFAVDGSELDAALPGAFGEDDYSYGTVSAEIDMLASVRGRVGYAMDSVMIYGTGGVAWADASARSEIVVSDPESDTESFLSGKEDFNDIGFVLGGGMAWMVIPQTFSVGIEGLYYFFDQKETLFDGTIDVPDPTVDTDYELDARATASLDDAWVIRARADFHF